MLGLQHVVTLDISLQHIAVAPPRGVRGLKFGRHPPAPDGISRTPSRGALVERGIPLTWNFTVDMH